MAWGRPDESMHLGQCLYYCCRKGMAYTVELYCNVGRRVFVPEELVACMKVTIWNMMRASISYSNEIQFTSCISIYFRVTQAQACSSGDIK